MEVPMLENHIISSFISVEPFGFGRGYEAVVDTTPINCPADECREAVPKEHRGSEEPERQLRNELFGSYWYHKGYGLKPKPRFSDAEH